MKYQGSKNKIAKYIVPIIQKLIDENDIKVYVEPFCGGCNIIDKIKAPYKIAKDINPYLIAMFQNLDKVKELDISTLTKDHYDDVRTDYRAQEGIYPAWYIGAVGFLASYNGRFFDGGYSGKVTTKDGKTRDYIQESYNNLMGQIRNLQDITFVSCDYEHFESKNCLIYCDPPYKNTKEYDYSKNFVHSRFWNWVRQKSTDNIVLVSEQEAPQDFEVMWEGPVARTINNTKRLKVTEKLFQLREKI